MKNLPAEMPDEEVRRFLESKGVPPGHPETTITRTAKSTNVSLEMLDSKLCQEMIKNLNDTVHFNRKVYCRGVRDLNTPEKVTQPGDPVVKLLSNPAMTITRRPMPIPAPGVPATALLSGSSDKEFTTV